MINQIQQQFTSIKPNAECFTTQITNKKL